MTIPRTKKAELMETKNIAMVLDIKPQQPVYVRLTPAGREKLIEDYLKLRSLTREVIEGILNTKTSADGWTELSLAQVMGTFGNWPITQDELPYENNIIRIPADVTQITSRDFLNS